jgi:hypothetical protein
MIKITSVQAIAGALLACGLSAAPAQAGPNRTWVSGFGTDSGTCALTAPCQTFAFALTQTNAGGEIDVLDPADYGTVTITQSISIVNDGVGVAGILTNSANAITINAGATDSVRLRGLTIDGLGAIVGLSSAPNGILFNTGGSLAIENCVIQGFAVAGINIQPGASTSTSFSVSNTIASYNGRGIFVHLAGLVAVTGEISNVTMNDNFDGIFVSGESTTEGSINVTIVDSEASNNGNFGVRAVSATGHMPLAVMLRNSVVSYNGVGLVTGTNATLRVGHSAVTGNEAGAATSGGTLYSYGDNDISGNSFDNTGALTPLPTH